MQVLPFILIVLAGILLGIFSIPISKVKGWEFEHIWFTGSLAALILVPWTLIILFVPNVSDIYNEISSSTILAVLVAGFAWGIGGIFWGLGINTLGLALGVSLMTSLINVFGSIGPLYIFQPELLTTMGGKMLILSLIVLILGIVATAIAGHFKDKSQKLNNDQDDSIRLKGSFLLGLIFCITSGILSCGVNFGLAFGSSIAEQAGKVGVADYAKSFAIWSLVFTANYIVNAAYGLVIMIKKGNIKALWNAKNKDNWIWVLFMGLAWPVGVILYGIGANFMGPMGVYVGFPMVMLISIIAGNLAGALNGEWSGANRKSKLIMISGILIVVAAFVFLGYSNQLLLDTKV